MSPDRPSRRPAHLRLRDTLAQKIAAGEWGAGKALPSESALARKFKVSSQTVRIALDILEGEHVVMRKRGGGAFVVDATCGPVESRSERASPGGGLTEGVADEAERERLQLTSKDRAYRIWCTRTSKGRLLVAERVILPAALYPGLAGQPQLADSIVDLARAYGLRLGQAHERASIGVASPLAAAALGLGEASRVLVLDRVVMTLDGRPAEWRVAECVLPHGVALADYAGC